MTRFGMIVGAAITCLALNSAGSTVVAQEEEQTTVITSERLMFDYQNNFALFEENVEVTDPSLHLVSDKLRVEFDEEGDLTEIKAKGNVIITQEGKIAKCGRADYDVNSGKIVLKDDPRLEQGQSYVVGTVITFWRDEDRMVCEPAHAVLYPSTKDSSNSLRGE